MRTSLILFWLFCSVAAALAEEGTILKSQGAVCLEADQMEKAFKNLERGMSSDSAIAAINEEVSGGACAKFAKLFFSKIEQKQTFVFAGRDWWTVWKVRIHRVDLPDRVLIMTKELYGYMAFSAEPKDIPPAETCEVEERCA